MEPPIEELQLKRDVYGTQLKRAADLVRNDELAGWDLAVLSMKRMVLDKAWEAFQLAHVTLMAHPGLSPEQLQLFDEEAVAVARLYSRPRALLDTHADVLKAEQGVQPARASEITIPTFSGRYREWTTWRAQFVAKVMSTNLPVGDKIDLLLNALSGEARLCAGQAERRDAEEFKRIWQKLETTYDNKYQIIVGHISAIMDLPRITSPSAKMMRNLVDTCDQELGALERFGYDTKEWSPVIAVMLLRKLDQTTLSVWEMDREPTEPPSWQDVRGFLIKRAIAIRNLRLASTQVDTHARANNGDRHEGGSSRSSRNQPGPSYDRDSYNHFKRSRTETEIVPKERSGPPPPPCFACGGVHFPWFCRKIKDMSFEGRIKFVADKRVCPCCLLEKHASSDCPRPGCPRCDNAKHNRVLCPKTLVVRPSRAHSKFSNKQ